MPPDGYDTITLPEETVEAIDEHAEAIGASSRAEAIEGLIESHDARVTAFVDELSDGAVEDIAARTSHRVAEELTDATSPLR